MSVLLWIAAIVGCRSEVPGVNFYARNASPRPVELRMAVREPSGRPLGELVLDVPAGGVGVGRWDGRFDTFVVDVSCLDPDGRVLASASAPWPGEAGTADGAGSQRIAVELRVSGTDEVALAFESSI